MDSTSKACFVFNGPATIRVRTHAKQDGSTQKGAKYKVYRSNHPLVGLSRYTPHLHVRIHTVPAQVHDPQTATSYDIIPQKATHVRTLGRMLAGQCVPAEIRVRKARWPLRDGHSFLKECGEGSAEYGRITDWIHAYRGCTCDKEGAVGISLTGMNCWMFANSLVDFLLS